jgi:hypothetical protein
MFQVMTRRRPPARGAGVGDGAGAAGGLVAAGGRGVAGDCRGGAAGATAPGGVMPGGYQFPLAQIQSAAG